MRRDVAFFAVVLFASRMAGAQGAPGAASTQQTRVSSKDGLTYVLIPAGRFRMGCMPNEQVCQTDTAPPHPVLLTHDFWMSTTLVTQAAYEKVMKVNPSHFLKATDETYGSERYLNKRTPPANFNAGKLPVEHVTWFDAAGYCSKVGMRLPTEAEWEYAARAGMTTARAAYPANPSLSIYRPAPVGAREPNPFGLYDTQSEMFQWVADWYGPYSADPNRTIPNPQGPPQGQYRVMRSWSFLWGLEPEAFYLSTRSPMLPEIGNDWISFRCVANEWPN